MFEGQDVVTFTKLLETKPGIVSLAAMLISILGIVLVGGAGMSKENELPEEQKKAAVAEFNFKKGILMAIFSGLMSAAMNFGLQGGPTFEEIASKRAGDKPYLARHARAGQWCCWADSWSTADGA